MYVRTQQSDSPGFPAATDLSRDLRWRNSLFACFVVTLVLMGVIIFLKKVLPGGSSTNLSPVFKRSVGNQHSPDSHIAAPQEKRQISGIFNQQP